MVGNSSPRLARPRSVTITAWGVFALGLLNIWRAAGISRQASLLLQLGVTLDPRVRLTMALIWAVVLVGLAVALWQRRSWSRLAVPVLLLLYALFQLALLAFFAPAAVARQGWAGYALVSALAIFFVVWALNRPAARRYFSTDKKVKGLDSGFKYREVT